MSKIDVYPNGKIPESELAPIVGGGFLLKEAAAGWNAMAYEIHAKEGWWIHTNGSQSSYRDIPMQESMKAYWCGQGNCGNAATPGTSNHGRGIACDVPPQVIAAIAKYGAKYGWSKAWSDAPWEDWHHCYQPGHYNGKDPYNSKYEKDPYPPLKFGSKNTKAVKKAQRQLARHNLGITRPKIDGDFGDTTEKAVKEFQWTHGLKDDGKIGDATWAKLRQKDVLFPDELTAVNRLRLAQRNGVQPGQEAEAKRNRQWIVKRIADFKTKGKQGKWWWSKYNRRKRFKILVKTYKNNWR